MTYIWEHKCSTPCFAGVIRGWGNTGILKSCKENQAENLSDTRDQGKVQPPYLAPVKWWAPNTIMLWPIWYFVCVKDRGLSLMLLLSFVLTVGIIYSLPVHPPIHPSRPDPPFPALGPWFDDFHLASGTLVSNQQFPLSMTWLVLNTDSQPNCKISWTLLQPL